MEYLTSDAPLDKPVTIKQDKLKLGWFLSSILMSLLSENADCEIVQEVWSTLQS